VIRAVIAALVVLAACGYGAPDYRGTRFFCGGGERCPPGQTCVGETCTVEIGDGVQCNLDVCAFDEQCCFNGVEVQCIPLTAGCPGPTAFCDGVEDCRGGPDGDYCCESGGEAICCADDFFLVCQDTEDCNAAEPECCFDDPDLSWGTCAEFCL
jgi:hypothetical protein